MSILERDKRIEEIQKSKIPLPIALELTILEWDILSAIIIIRNAFNLSLTEARLLVEMRKFKMSEGKPMIDTEHCTICHNELNQYQKDYNLKHYQASTCGAPECIQRDIINRYGCCERATLTPCVCMYSFTCPVHGEKHIGTHD